MNIYLTVLFKFDPKLPCSIKLLKRYMGLSESSNDSSSHKSRRRSIMFQLIRAFNNISSEEI